MSQTGLREFDASIQETNEWLHEIADAMGFPNRRMAYHALRGVLFALRDRLPPGELFDLSAQLPMVMRGILFESYSPMGKPVKMNRDEFLECVACELDMVGGENPVRATRAVLETMENRVDPGELRQVRRALPADIRALWRRPVAQR